MSGKVFQASSTAEEQEAGERYLQKVSQHPMIRTLRASAVDMLSVAPGDRVLDVGCGLGEMSREFADMVGPDGSVTAVDLNPRMVATARKRHVTSPEAAAVTYELGDVVSIDYPDGFDVVWCERLMQLVPDPDAAIYNMVRLLSPGGRVCVVDVDWGALVVDGADEAMTARVLGAFRSKILWPTVGRTLRRRLVRAGMVDPALRSVHTIFTSLADAASLIPVLDRRQVGLVAEVDRAAWFDSLESADARGEFMMAISLYVAVAENRRQA